MENLFTDKEAYTEDARKISAMFEQYASSFIDEHCKSFKLRDIEYIMKASVSMACLSKLAFKDRKRKTKVKQ